MSILRTSWRSSRVRLPQSFEEFLPGSSSASFVLGCSAEHTSSAGPPSGPSFFVPSSVIQELFASGSAPASLCQKFSRPLAQSGRFGSQLQAPYETSSVTSSTFLQPNFQPRLHLDSSAPKQQVVGPSMDVLGSSFCGKIPLSSSEPFLDNRCFQVWLGCRLPPSSGVGPLVQTGISCSYQLLRTLYCIPRSSEF